jgi:hypothetical protein
LIDNGVTQLGYAYFNDVFTMATGIEFSFDFALWKRDSIVGDGFSAFFSDADVPLISPRLRWERYGLSNKLTECTWHRIDWVAGTPQSSLTHSAMLAIISAPI